MGIQLAERTLAKEVNQSDLVPSPAPSEFYEHLILNDDGWFNYFFVDKEAAQDNRDYCIEKGFKTSLKTPDGRLI